MFTLCLIDYIDAESLSVKVSNYEQAFSDIWSEIDKAESKPWGPEFLQDMANIQQSALERIPAERPSKGILTDFSDKTIQYLKSIKFL